jgi:hypothetical protein
MAPHYEYYFLVVCEYVLTTVTGRSGQASKEWKRLIIILTGCLHFGLSTQNYIHYYHFCLLPVVRSIGTPSTCIVTSFDDCLGNVPKSISYWRKKWYSELSGGFTVTIQDKKKYSVRPDLGDVEAERTVITRDDFSVYASSCAANTFLWLCGYEYIFQLGTKRI